MSQNDEAWVRKSALAGGNLPQNLISQPQFRHKIAQKFWPPAKGVGKTSEGHILNVFDELNPNLNSDCLKRF